jgi:adenine/guanine phosphoribosyltransferase-like PRPP-binding protein
VIASDYLRKALDRRSRSARIAHSVEIAREMQRHFRFETVVITGWSGALIGIPIADALDLSITFLRKPDSSHHSSQNVEGLVKVGTRALFVDDFMSSGDTFRKVKDALQRYRMPITGVLLYAADTSRADSLLGTGPDFKFKKMIAGYGPLE